MYRLKYLSNPKAKGFIAVFTAIAALFLGSCAMEEEPGGLPPYGESSVMFDAYLSGISQSRASVADVEKLKFNSFGVFAFDTGQEPYNPDITGGHVPTFMYNRQVKWVSDAGSTEVGKWTYSPEASWSGSNISFFAYAPYTTKFGGDYGITALTGEDVAGDPKLSFTVANDVKNQIDLLYAKAIDCTQGVVQFNFDHALSRISFKLLEVKVDDQTSIGIENVTFRSADFAASGNLNLRTGEWENLTKSNETKYEFNSTDFVVSNGSLMPGSDNYMMIMPSGETTVNVTVSYTVTTTDEKLSAGVSKFTNKITRPMEINLLAGKAYDITLKVTPTSVTFDAEVSDWEESINKDLDSSTDSNSK